LEINLVDSVRITGKQTKELVPQTMPTRKNDNYCNFSIHNTFLTQKSLKPKHIQNLLGHFTSESIHI
jgi:hypothetical protein